MDVLVINCGSSSLKFSVLNTGSGQERARGIFARLGGERPDFEIRRPDATDPVEQAVLPAGYAHREALDRLAGWLAEPAQHDLAIAAVGHRVVHGGEHFTKATRVDDDTLAAIEACCPLAPLHNPSNLLGIRRTRDHFPNLPQVAVFDTAFHQTMPAEAYLYALPMSWYREHGIRRYGFHGSSHKFVVGEAAALLGRPLEETNLITLHLGNGCSAAAVAGGQVVDTSMGLTPLEGLVMGTRSGDVDPGIVLHLQRSLGLSVAEVDDTLNQRSGLLGLSELSNDMRELRRAAGGGHDGARQAIDVFGYRLAKSVSALRAALTGLDAIVFTGGIGENDAETRTETAGRLRHLGLELNENANAAAVRGARAVISSPDSPVRVLVIPTNEELMIARETDQVLSADVR